MLQCVVIVEWVHYNTVIFHYAFAFTLKEHIIYRKKNLPEKKYCVAFHLPFQELLCKQYDDKEEGFLYACMSIFFVQKIYLNLVLKIWKEGHPIEYFSQLLGWMPNGADLLVDK